MKKHVLSVLTPALFLLPLSLNASLYYWNDTEGNLIASDQPPPTGTDYRTQNELRAMNVIPMTSTTTSSITADDKQDVTDELPVVKWSPSSASISTSPSIPASISAVDNINTTANDIEPTTASLQPDDEAGCQKLYGLNCDRVFNWQEASEKYCATTKHEKCADTQWLERRFKPIPLAERQQRTLRNAAQNNRRYQEVRDYLHRKYTGICATDPNKLPRVCKNPAYDAKIFATFQKLNSKDQAEIRKLQDVLKTSDDRDVIDRALEELLTYLPWAVASQGL